MTKMEKDMQELSTYLSGLGEYLISFAADGNAVYRLFKIAVITLGSCLGFTLF